MAQAALEERVARLEGKVEGFDVHFGALSRQISGTQLRIDELDQRLTGRIDALDQKVDRFREELSAQMVGLDQRLSSRINELDQRLTGRIDNLDRKIDRNFQWTMGVNVVLWSTILVALFVQA